MKNFELFQGKRHNKAFVQCSTMRYVGYQYCQPKASQEHEFVGGLAAI